MGVRNPAGDPEPPIRLFGARKTRHMEKHLRRATSWQDTLRREGEGSMRENANLNRHGIQGDGVQPKRRAQLLHTCFTPRWRKCRRGQVTWANPALCTAEEDKVQAKKQEGQGLKENHRRALACRAEIQMRPEEEGICCTKQRSVHRLPG